MCFIKSSTPNVANVAAVQESVVRHEANADLTKKSKTNLSKSTFDENLKTAYQGLEDIAPTDKKTLLGE